jgi:DNA polymerase I-like protein with 3'-5' exonuclease and polymerase domains
MSRFPVRPAELSRLVDLGVVVASEPNTAADLMKMALIRLNDALPDGARILLPVHDSVLLELPEGLVEETRRIVVAVLEAMPAGFSVPLKAKILFQRGHICP